MPKIKISGIDLDKYKDNTSLEDYYYSLESIETPFEDDINSYSDSIGTEGIVGSAFKGAAAVTRAGVGAVKQAKGMVKSAARMVKSQWRTIYPALLQGFQKMGQNLKNIWAKLMKYDKRFQDLGENMRELTELGGAQQINRMGKITIKVYPIDWAGVKTTLDYIRSWDKFVITMCGLNPSTGEVVGNANQHQGALTTMSQNTRDFNNNVETGTKIVGVGDLGKRLSSTQDRDHKLKIIAEATRTNNLILARYNASSAIAKLLYQGRETYFTNTVNRLKNSAGHAEGAVKNLFTGSLIKSAGNIFGFIKDGAMLPLSMVSDGVANAFGVNSKQKMKKLTGSGSTSAKIVQTILTGFEPVEITFGGEERDRFVAWIEGNGNDICKDYCISCAQLLGKGTSGGTILAKAIRTGGESCKVSVDKTLKQLKKQMDYLYKAAEENDKKYGEELAQNNQDNNQNVGSGAAGAGGSTVDFNDTSSSDNNNQNNNDDIPEYRTEVDALNAFIGSYHNILGTLADNYQGFVQGLLMATYSIVEDGESIVHVVNQCRGGDPKKKGANINAEDQ
jgi:hypothetical protein